jgi:aspartyl protease family protein
MSRLLAAAAVAVALAAAVPWIDNASRGPKPRDPRAPSPEPEGKGVVALTADRAGHFTVRAGMGDRCIDLMVDTGATTVTLTHEDARQLGIHLWPDDHRVPVATANGLVRAASVRIHELRVGTIRLGDVKALVVPPGALSRSLLGMSFIGRLSRFEMRGRRLILEG